MARMLGIATGLLLTATAVSAQVDPGDRRFQDFVKDAWSLEAGLPQITVSAVEQGPEGYIWVGTQQGVARFDGVRFQTWTADQLDALPGNFIYALHTDSRGRLWIGTYKGLTRYHNRRFEHIAGPSGPAGNPMALTVRDVVEAPDGRVLVGADEGLFEVRGDALARVSLPEAGPVTALHIARGRVQVGSLGHYWSLVEDRFLPAVRLPADNQSVQITGFAHHDGQLWIATSTGLFRQTPEGLVPFREPAWLAGQPVDVVFNDHSGNLWVGTDRGLLRIRNSRLFEVIDSDHPNSHRQIQSIAQDHEGNLWLGSFRDGIARFWPGWAERFNEPQGLHESLIWSVADAGGGDLWVGTNDGLSRLEDERYQLQIPGTELPHPHAYTLTPSEEGLWIGTRRGLVRYDPATGEQTVPNGLERLNTYQINGIVPAGEHGQYFFATTGGLFLLDNAGQLSRASDRIGETVVRQLSVEANGSLLVATQRGLYAGYPGSLVNLDRRHGLDPEADYSAIHRIGPDVVVFASIDNGLYVGDDGDWKHLTTEDGLPTNAAYFVTDDDDQYLWVAGFHGLYRVPLAHIEAVARGETPEPLEANMILSESGRHIGSQQAYCCNGAGHAKGLMRDDGLWLPTRGGVIRVSPEGIQRNQESPPVLIEQIRHGGEWHTHYPDSGYRLPRGERDLGFAFTALSYQDPNSVRIQYRLVGYDDDWQPLENVVQRQVSYTNLPPGDYRFEVRAANNAGIWADSPARIDFTIPPYFHETIWFPLTLLAVLLLLFFAGYRWRVRRLRQRQAELEGEVTERTEELRVANNRLVEANRALRDASQTDPLTGLRNRRYLYGQMARDLAHFERIRDKLPEEDLVLVFALVDVDYFKRINDDLGHRAGDLVLKQLCERLEALVRTGDYVVRWGGEEFLIVFREMSRGNTERIIDRLQRGISREPYRVDEHESVPVTVSIGFAEYPLRSETDSAGLSWEAIVDLADHALYEVKRNGRDGWAVIRPDNERDPIEFLRAVRRELDAALEDGRARMTGSWQAPVTIVDGGRDE